VRLHIVLQDACAGGVRGPEVGLREGLSLVRRQKKP